MAQYENPKELIVNFQDVDHLVDGLSKDLVALFVEVDDELIDVLVYAVREHFAVIPFKPQRRIKFTLRNLARHETLGDANLKMSILNNFEGSLEHTLYLDGREKYRIDSQSHSDDPFAQLVYEWRDPDEDPDKEDFDEVRYIIEQSRSSHQRTEEIMREVEFHFAYIARSSVERSLVKQIQIEEFREVTIKQHNTSRKILENLQEFASKEGGNLGNEVASVESKVEQVDMEITKLEASLGQEQEAQNGLDDNVRNHAPVNINFEVPKNTDGRLAIKEEIARTTRLIEKLTLENYLKSSKEGHSYGLEQTSSKLSSFEDINGHQSKIKGVKVKLDSSKAEIRSAQCDLAAKEFELANLESESKELAQQDRDLNMKIRESEEALQAMLADRKDANDRGTELDDRANEYEQLLIQIESEVDELKKDAESKSQITIQKDVFSSSTNNTEFQKLESDLEQAENDRDAMLEKLEGMEGAWIESVEHVSKEAENLVADPGDSKFNKNVQKLLKDILDASNRSADLYQDLEITDQQINLNRTVDTSAMTAEFANDVKLRNNRLESEEKETVDLINIGVESLEAKIKTFDKEKGKIPALQNKLDELLMERDEMVTTIEEYTIRIEEKQAHGSQQDQRYQSDLNTYNERLEEMNYQIKELKRKIGDTNTSIMNISAQISALEEELQTWFTKIKIKKGLIKKRMDAEALEDEYVPALNDPIDLKVSYFKNKKVTRIPIKRIEPGQYMFATTRVEIFLDGKQPSNYTLKLKKSGKKFDLEDFITNEADKELEKI